jgi:hypothetical protein
MSPEELTFIYKHASAYGLAALAAAGVIYIIVRLAIGSYLTEKGKNLATREDLEHLTRIVEEAKAPFTSLQEELKARHQLRLAGIDRRLQTHQEAFTLWRELLGTVHTDDVGKSVLKCQTWWENNCLYLEPEVRQSFVQAYSAAHLHRTLTTSRTDSDTVSKNWKEITQFPEVLFKAVQLPPLSELERKAIGQASTP